MQLANSKGTGGPGGHGHIQGTPRKLASESSVVLVVDDDPDIREMMASLLEWEGYTVKLARDGAEALELLKKGLTPQLILLDLMMPVMDGWTFCAEKAKDPVLAPIPVVTLSAVARRDQRHSCVGALAHMTKPIAVPELLALVERHR